MGDATSVVTIFLDNMAPLALRGSCCFDWGVCFWICRPVVCYGMRVSTRLGARWSSLRRPLSMPQRLAEFSGYLLAVKVLATTNRWLTDPTTTRSLQLAASSPRLLAVRKASGVCSPYDIGGDAGVRLGHTRSQLLSRQG
ncbi:hypothetical protein M378DRAFT_1012949 [Amanita muscaria Koide BX008]|uniref:Uncharacterized protein n=1 Tax=Amanita muscaria (strain Koide BX008) TaxID=946122 RepID=A0A0C2SYR5_AMAMK|nr:hypothetical protein M378DRAFT_1012949 [Amanita muscaria Koide BX008]